MKAWVTYGDGELTSRVCRPFAARESGTLRSTCPVRASKIGNSVLSAANDPPHHPCEDPFF
jgi:hypothetical protein